ncbi:MAG: hypothetical protein D6696_00720 [Acidobacteria bacterium]|nr:MAG: hypothetical protein D6696_00720 [Acidobacteriota bacterium]
MAEADSKLLTLTEVSRRTGISMPTLQRYKKLYQDRIPSEGKGRTQRYPEEALAVFEQLKKENVKRRGRPRKAASAAAAPKRARKTRKTKTARKKKTATRRKRTARKKTAGEGLLTLTQIKNVTGISYPTLLRYVRLHLKKIPHKGSGRGRRYLPEAVEVFQRLRAESPRGRAASKAKGTRRKAAAGAGTSASVSRRIRALESGQKEILRYLKKLEKAVKKPIRLSVRR